MEICAFIDAGNLHKKAAEHFGMPRRTVSCIWNRRDEIRALTAQKVNPDVKGFFKNAIDEPLRQWYYQMKERNVPFTGSES